MPPTPPSSALLLVLAALLGGCIAITDVYPFRVGGDDDDSAADDDDSGDDDDDSGGDDDDATPCDTSWLVELPDAVSLAFEIEPVFANNCDPCHTTLELGGLNVAPGQSHAALVDQPNTLDYGPGMPRVTPFDPQASYLMHKIVGCGETDPDWGHFQSEMPPPVGETIPLTEDEVILIYSWIVQGAEDN